MIDLTVFSDPYQEKPVTSLGDMLARASQGRTVSGRFTGRSFLNEVTEDDFPPNSKYWAGYARGAMQKLGGLLGGQWMEFADAAWPGNSIERLTWRAICEMTEEAIRAHEGGERDPLRLAEAAHGYLVRLVSRAV